MHAYVDDDLLPACESDSGESDSGDHVVYGSNTRPLNANAAQADCPCDEEADEPFDHATLLQNLGATRNRRGLLKTVMVFSFGFAQGPRPPTLGTTCCYKEMPEGCIRHRTFDCRKLVNPSKKSRSSRTGLDKRLRNEVLHAPGTEEFVKKCLDEIIADLAKTAFPDGDDPENHPLIFRYDFGCHVGKHRSVAVTLAVAQRLEQYIRQTSDDVRILVRHCNVG